MLLKLSNRGSKSFIRTLESMLIMIIMSRDILLPSILFVLILTQINSSADEFIKDKP